MRAQRGFVLVNALVLVGALAAAAMVLLVRAEMSVQRHSVWQSAAQIEAYLDAVDTLAMSLLEADAPGGADHMQEVWAEPIRTVELDRGDVTGRIQDLQGRFNVNWLSVPEDLASQEAFDRLLVARGLTLASGAAIRAFLTPGQPANLAAYAGASPATLPRGGPIRNARQLLTIPQLSPELFARLAPVIAALPSDTRLNVNTAPSEVLDAWLPGVDGALARQLVDRRRREPYTSVEDFVLDLPADVAAALDEARLVTSSDWFVVQATARLDGRSMSRQTVLVRQPLPVGVSVDYRLPDG